MKLKKEILFIIGIILTIVLAFIYKYSFFIPQKIEIEPFDVIKINNESLKNIEITEVSKNKSIITYVLDEIYLKEEEVNNYVFGTGSGVNIDFSIVVKKGDNYFKLKTLINDIKYDIGKIYFDGYIPNKYLTDEIYLYNNDTNEFFMYEGER